ncbi:hypothetical protein C8J42_1085 [Sphingomonas sp. PP-CE-1A-559]|uniref:hypothetical protein n=1 Tax=Sphingomonas sp. PP-CE-1A-559 TaxID=2135657 RepID=UPI0010556AF5|nr:hypothetical protein [Sphingomonas sp. PP-CE-1A-559]TCP87951.1 hypothetical protein C8J42_1085 [Sphingomonas sp. PP-CE-1A-559]
MDRTLENLPLSIPSERLIGFTVPADNRFLVCDHNEVWELITGVSTSVDETDFVPYKVAEQPDFVGWGKEDAAPVLKIGDSNISYNFDPKAAAVQVRYEYGANHYLFDFPTLSGDWFCASLSRDGNLLVLAEPYQIRLYRTPL